MDKIVLDTNALLRFLLNDIPSQAEDVEKLIKLAKAKKITLFVPQIVIFEIVYALIKEYDFDKAFTISQLEKILQSTYIDIQDRDILKEAVRFFALNNLSLADCFIFCFTKNKNARLFTFDKNLQKLMAKKF